MHQKPYPPASANIVFSWKSVMSNRTGDHPSFHDAGRSSRNRVLLDFQVRNKGFKISHGHPISHKSLSPRLLRHLLPEISTSPPHCRCQVEHKHQKNKKHSYFKVSDAKEHCSCLIKWMTCKKVTIPGRPSV